MLIGPQLSFYLILDYLNFHVSSKWTTLTFILASIEKPSYSCYPVLDNLNLCLGQLWTTSIFKLANPEWPLLSLWQDLDNIKLVPNNLRVHYDLSWTTSNTILAKPEQLLQLFNFVLNKMTLLSGKFSSFCTEVPCFCSYNQIPASSFRGWTTSTPIQDNHLDSMWS